MNSLRNWARKRASRRNFVITTYKSWSSSDIRFGRVILTCEHYGVYRKGRKAVDGDNDEETVKLDTQTKKDRCPFELSGRECPKGCWTVEVIEGVHNHTHPTKLIGHSFAGRLKPKELVDVESSTKAGSRPKDVLTKLRHDVTTNVTSRDQIYAARARMRKNLMGDRTPTQYLLSELVNKGYLFQYRLDSEGRIGDLAFFHPDSIKLWKMFSYVLLMDTTYGTNKYAPS